MRDRLALYLDLIRWNRPAGWLLLLWPSLSALSTFCPPRTAVTAASSDLRFKPFCVANLPQLPLLSHMASKNNSLATN